MKKLVFNIASVAKFKILCLFALLVLTWVNNEALAWWTSKKPAHTEYKTGSVNTVWSDPSTWDGGSKPNGVAVSGGGDLITVQSGHTLTIDMDNVVIAAIYLETNAHLVITASNVKINGNGTQNYCIAGGNGATINIAEGVTVTDEKGVGCTEGNITIGGKGTLTVGGYFETKSTSTITTSANILLNKHKDGNDNDFYNTKAPYIGGTSKIIVADGTLTNNRKGKTITSLEIEGGKFVSSYNTTCGTLTLSGGTLEIAAGSNLTVSDGVLTVTGDAVLKGTGTLNVSEIYIASTATLTIDGSRTFDGVKFTGGGKLKIADGTTLTLKGTTKDTKFDGDITILAGEEDGEDDDELYTGKVEIENSLKSDTEGSTLSSEVSLELKSGGTFENFNVIDIKGGTFTNNRIGAIEKIKVANGAKLSTSDLTVTSEAELLGRLENGDVTVTGDKITFGTGTGFGVGTSVTINSSSGTATIDGLGNCYPDHITLSNGQAVTYNNSTCILPATYTSLTFNGTEATLCGVAEVGGSFALSQNITISGDNNLTLKGAITGNKDITISGATVDVVAGGGAVGVGTVTVKDGGSLSYDRPVGLTNLNVDGTSTIEFGETAGTLTLTNPTLGGEVSVADGIALTLTGNVTFGENTNVDYNSGNGVIKISNNAVIDSLRSCNLGLLFVDAKPTITYKENSTCILGGTYAALTVESSTATLCDVVTVEGAFALTKNISVTSSSKSLALQGAVSGGKIITATGTAIAVSNDVAFAGGFVIGSGSLTIERECALDTLAVNDGEVALDAATTVTGITVSGGSVSINAETEVNHSFAVSGGEVTLGDEVTVLQDFILTDGELTISAATTVNGNATLDATINLTGANASLMVGGSGKTVTFGSNTSISDGSKLIIGDGSTIDGLKNCITGVDLDSKNIIYGPQAEVILPADYATLQTNSDVTLCGGSVSVAGAFTWNSGNVTLNGYNLTLNGALGGNTTYNKDHTIMVCHNGGANGQLIRSGFDALTNFQFPIGTTKGNTRQFAMVTITGGFTKEIDANPASISITTTNAIDLTVGSALNLKRSWDIETGNISELTNVGIVFKYDETDSETNDFDALAKDGAVVENESPVSIVFDRVDEEIIVEGLTEIEGHWTAIDKGLMLYSTGNGNWNTKSTWINEQGENDFPNETYNVIISEGHTVTMAEGTFTAKRVGIYGTLNKADKSFSGVRYVFGEGVLQVEGTFAGGDADYTEFLSETGGTVELMGNFNGQSSFNFNNLILNNEAGDVSTLDLSGANILGDLIIRGGNMEFDGDGAITIGDSIRVESGQTLTFSSTPEVTVSAIDAKVGNVAINGNVTITDSVDLAGTNFTVNTDKSLILSNGTKHTTEATVGGAGNVELADGKNLKGTITFANLKMTTAGTVDGNITTTNFLSGGNVTINGDGKLTISEGTTPAKTITVNVKKLELSGSGTISANFVINEGDTLINSRPNNIPSLTINNGIVETRGSITNALSMTGINSSFKAKRNIIVGGNATLSGTVETDEDVTLTFQRKIDFSGIETFKGSFAANNTNYNTTISNLSKCLGNDYSFSAAKNITYDETSDYMLSGNYQKLIIGNTNIRLCNTVIVNTDFSPSVNTTLTGVGESVFFAVKRNVTEGKSISFSNVNVELGQSNVGGTEISATGLNIAAGNTLTIKGNVKVVKNDLTFGGTGAIVINDTLSSASQTVTFSDGQIIDGTGRLLISGGKIDGGKLITKANVEITGGTNSVAEYEVRGGTFTNNGGSAITKLTVFKNATLKAATNTTVGTLTVADGGTIVIADNKTLTASTGSLNVSGAATITSEGSSSISAANVELASNSKLTINKTIKLNNPLQIKHGNDTIVGGTDAVLDWTGTSENYKVTVVAGKLLALGGTLTINKDVTLAGSIVPMAHSVLNLGGSEVTFTAASNFGDAAGEICFTRAEGVTIKSLQSDPKVASSHVEYAGTVTYDAACTGMLPGVYPALTLNTAESKNISMFDSVTVDGTLTWTNGRIALNNKVLTISEVYASADAFSADKMVVAGGNGTLIYKEKSSSTRTLAFPVGTFTYTNMGDIVYRYSPVTVSGVNTVVGDTIKVSVEGESFSGSSSDLNRYWTIKARTNMGGNLTLQYDNADDIKGYGASDGHYWSVFHNNGVLAEGDEDLQSPYDNNIITIENVTICGIWTAVEYPVLTTLYSFKTGPWDDVNTWTTISDGSKWVNPGLKPSRTNYYDIVILGSDSVFVRPTDNYLHARSITLKGQDTKLTVIKDCDVDVNNLLGKGTFILNDQGVFPEIEHTEDFMSPDGGTTMFSGNPDGDSYELSQSQFNNLVIKYTKNDVKLTLPNTISRLVINGRLELDNGALVYTADKQAIHVNGDINIDREGKILTTVNVGSRTQADTLQVRGNLYNRGKIALTNRVWDDYTTAVAKVKEDIKGRGIIRFVGETNNRFECYDTTNFSQLIIDKGVDETYRLTVYSEGEKSFGLLGCATNQGTLDGFAEGVAYPSDPEVYYKPLWIKCGTLELTGDVYIRSLAEDDGTKQYDCAYIPASGCLHLNGPKVKVDATINTTKVPYASVIPAGRLIVEAGTFDGKGSSGITFVGTSYVEVKGGGIMRLAQFRPSDYAANGTATFKLSDDGLVEITGDGDVKPAQPAFSMPDVSYIFEMTGGTLKTTTALGGGAFVVKSNPRNGKIEGGVIEINTGAARKDGKDESVANYLIASEIPLYNLVLKNQNVDVTTKYVKHYIDNTNVINGKINGKDNKVLVTASTVIKNDLIIYGDVVFDTYGKKITVGGNLEVKDGATVYTYKDDKSENEFVMNGEGTIKIGGDIVKNSTDATPGFFKLTIDENAHIKMKNDIDVRGKFTLAEGAIMEDEGENHVYTLHGDAEFDGTYKREPTGAGKIVFKGANIFSKGNGKVNNLEINAGSDVLLKHPTNPGTQTKLTITGKLDFATDTRFNIGINNLTLDEQATVVATGGEFGKDRMIVTLGSGSLGVTKVYSENHPSFLFPFGFNNSGYYYTPASIGYSAADAWGSVTSRPVSGYAFRTTESLNCYWINSETGFDNTGTMTFNGYWYSDALTPSGNTGYEAGRRNGGDWECYGTASVNTAGRAGCPEERYMQIADDISATGYYSCGKSDAFLAGVQLFTSKYAEGDTVVDWKDWTSWSRELGGEPVGDGYVPNANTAVQIGGIGKNHKVVITGNSKESASLNIAPGSSLDLGTTTGHNFQIIEVDEAVGAGTLMLASQVFPDGDFAKFNGAHGGTVKYYVVENKTTYTLNATPANYCNLIVGGYDESHQIIMPDGDITVYRDFTVDGWARSNSNKNHTVVIDSNMIIANGRFSMWENGSKKKVQTYKVMGDVTIAEGAELIADGDNSPANTANILEIHGDLEVDGVFNAANGSCIFNTVFKGATDSKITNTTNDNIKFNTLECNKDNVSAKLVLTTNKIQSATENQAHPNGYLMTFTRGTLEVDFENQDDVIYLTKKANFDVPGEGCLSVVSGKVVVADDTDATCLDLYGQIVIEDKGKLYVGAIDGGGSKYNSILYAPEGRPTITINGGLLTVLGQISRQKDQIMGSLVWEQSGGDVVIKGHNRSGGPGWLVERAAFEIKNSGSFTMSGGTITTKAGGGVDACGDIFIIPETANCTGGTIIVGGGDQKLHTTVALNHLKVNTGSSLAVYNRDIVLDSLTIEGSGVFNAQNHKITIRKAFANHNNNSEDLVNKISSGYVTGSSTQVTRFENDVTLECVGDFSTQFGMLEIDGDLTLKPGCSKIRVASDLTQYSGTVTDNGNTISLFGDLWYEGVFDGVGGIDFCNKDVIQHIRGSENETRSLGTIIISNPNEVFLNTQLHITKNIYLGASLYTDHNSITLDQNASILPKPGTDGFSSTRMIRLNGEHGDFGITKYVQTGPSEFTLPIGIVDNGERHYTPAEYLFRSNSFSGAYITIKPINFLHKNLSLTPSHKLNYYWHVVADGFDEATEDVKTDCGFNVKQTYTFTDSKVDGDVDIAMKPEFLYSNGVNIIWADLGDHAAVDVEDNQIIFDNIGHLSGDYTAGVIGTNGIYTGLDVMYSQGNGRWVDEDTWEIFTNADDPSASKTWQTPSAAPDGNPIHIRPGDMITVTGTVEAYSLCFDDTLKNGTQDLSLLGKLDLGASKGSDFGPVSGAGWLRMEPDGEYHQYKMPAGNFDLFLRDERTVVEFSGANGFLPNAVIGHVSLPLQNVVLSGTNVKTLTKEDGEYINGYMEIRNGTQLKFNNTPIYIKGDWIDLNKASSGFDGGTSDTKSVVEFNGTSRGQNISLANDQTSFWKLKINNSNGDTIVKNAAAEVGVVKMGIGKQLILGNGDLFTSASAYPVMASAATITGASATSYIQGPLARKMDKNGSFTFPIGDETEYAPIAFLDAQPVVDDEEWLVTYHNSSLYGGEGYTCDPTLTEACRTEFWTVVAPGNTKAKLKLRANTHSFGALRDANLKRVKIVGLDKTTTVWHVIESSHVTGTILPLAMVVTDEAINLNDYRAFSLGYAGPSANLLVPKVSSNATFYICDGEGGDYDGDGADDKVEVPIYFTGIGGPYVVTYSVSLEGVGSKEFVKSVTVNGDNVGTLTFTGYELGEVFGRAVGYNVNPYQVKLVSVTEDGDNCPILNETNTASIYVMYNAVPEITGATIVGMRDTRLYSADNSGTVVDVNPYTWEILGSYSGKVTPVESTVNDREPKFNFDQNIEAGVPTPYNVTLKVTKVYKAISGESTCTRYAEKTVSVKIKPQPQIHSVTTDDVFAACTGTEYRYETEKISGHEYTWKASNGTITWSLENACTVTWASDPGQVIVLDSVSYKVSDEPEVWEKIGGADTVGIQVNEGISLGDGKNTLADNTYVCDNTYGSIVIGNTNGSYSYTLYKSDGTPLSETFTGKNDGSSLTIGTKNLMQYSDATPVSFYVVVRNIGCSDRITGKNITMLKKPVLATIPPVVSSTDLYIGNLALIDGAVKDGDGIANIASYSFVYSGDGVTYDDEKYAGEKPNDWEKNFGGYDKATNNTLKVKVPFADKLKGTLNVYSTATDGFKCSSSYDIDAGTISQDYLWRGKTDDWNNANNWWAGIPDGNKNVVIRSGKYISDVIGAADGDDMGAPTLSGNYSVNDITIVSGASVSVDNGKTLTINGDVDCAGEFKGGGTVVFNDEHNVSGTSPKFTNLTNSGTVTAASDITVTGTINNTGSFTGDAKDVILSGGSVVINGTGEFENVTVKAGAGNDVIVSGTPTINGTMTLNSGLVKVSDGQQISFSAEGEMVKAGNSWIVGKVGKTWGANTDNLSFYIGSPEHIAQVDIKPESSGATFTASYRFNNAEHVLAETENLTGDLTRVSGMERWDIHNDNNVGSLITLYFDEYSEVTDPDKLVVAHKNNEGKWEELTAGHAYTSSSVTGRATSYSDFTLGTKEASIVINPLPVTFAAFAGRQVGNSVVLDWATLSEKDNDYFEIERSLDGVNFVTIGYVGGAGDSDRRIDYTFSDNAPEQGRLYYRLSQVDFDGTRVYADKVVSVLYAGSETEQLTIVPNPTDGRFRVSATGSMAGGVVQLLSQTGSVVRTINVDGFDAVLDISDLPNGIYLLRFVADTKILQQKVVKY